MIPIRQKRSKAQSWSVDILLAVVIFIGTFFIFYLLLNENENKTAINLKDEASLVIKQTASQDSYLRIVDNEEINESRFVTLKNVDYDELKRRFRVDGDFCIYLEDANGNLVLVNKTYVGIGSTNIGLNDIPCSQK